MKVTLSLKTVARLGLMVLASTFALSSLANATSSRTFVASTGNDTNTASSCGLATPCRTFAGAYSVTVAGGEIIALDTAGYGSVNITGAVSIIGTPPGAEISVAASGTGITIAAGSGVVALRNIVVNGGSSASSTGISVTSGHVIIQDSVLKFLATGLALNNTKVDLKNTDIIGNGVGIQTTGTGTDFGQGFVSGGYGPTQARLFGGSVMQNTTAFFMINPGLAPSVGANNVSNVTILVYNQGSSQTLETVGNGAIVSGSGTGCPGGTTSGECNTTGFFGAINADGTTQP